MSDSYIDCKVCPKGMFQNEVGKVECKNCPTGTMRSPTELDDTHWDGETGAASNTRVANEMADCIVCESGKFNTMKGKANV